MSEWKECLFIDTFEIPLRNGLTKPSRVRGSGLRMVNMKEIFAYDRIDDSVEMECVPVDENEKISLLEYDDLLFARQSLVESGAGKIAIFKGNKPTVFESHLIRCRVNKKIAAPDFVYYYWKSPLGKGNISSIVTQTAAAGIKGSVLQTLPILLPPLSEQKAITCVLGSLDYKIDLLHRQNKTLEAMTETLFRQWFANEENNSSISQLITIQNGYAFKSKDFTNDGIHQVIKIKNILNSIVNIHNTDYVSNEVIKNLQSNFKIESGDILIAMTGAEIGKLGIIPNTNRCLWLNQRVGMLREKYPNSKYLAYLQLKSEFGQDHINNTATGSAQPNISGTGIEECGFPNVSEKEITACSNQIEYFYKKIIVNLGQILTLEKLRDTLLPKLMSGELRVAL